jgi:hypothetical protein
MGFQANIPHFYCKLRKEYLYNLTKGKGEFVNVKVFAIDSIEGRAIGFDVVTDFGAMFARMPISAFTHKDGAPDFPLDWLELWDCFSYNVDVITYASLKETRCAVLLKDRKWYEGDYMFTISWYGSQYAEDAGDSGFKRAHIVKLDVGCFAAQPNNRMRWFDMDFIIKPFPDNPDFMTNTAIWTCEDGAKWATENSDRYFYSVDEKKKPPPLV